MNLLLKSALLYLLLIFASGTAKTQIIADPLTPSGIPMLEDAGVFAGVGGNIQNGAFYSNCPCDFIDGRGLSFVAGFLYEKELFPKFRYGADALYRSDKLNSSYIEIEPVTVVSAISGKRETVKASSRHTGDLALSSIALQPFIKFYPFQPLYFKLAFSVSIPVSSNIIHTQELLKKTTLLSTGEIGNIYFTNEDGSINNASIITLQDEKYPELNGIYLGLIPTIGIDFRLSKKMNLSPSFQFYIPIGNISDYSAPPSYPGSVDYKGFSITSWYFRIEFRHTLLSDE